MLVHYWFSNNDNCAARSKLKNRGVDISPFVVEGSRRENIRIAFSFEMISDKLPFQ